jgi:catechol 2,3-dioxygenase-like lactoylglutathione lyase family enzyme
MVEYPIAPGPVHHIALTVADLEASARFYGALLGMHETLNMTMDSAPFCRLLNIPDGSRARIKYFDGGPKIGQIELVEWQDHKAPAPTGDVDVRAHGANIISFAWDHSLEELHTRLTDAGVPCLSPPETMELPGFGFIHVFIGLDPDRRPIEFVRLPTRDEVREYRARTNA